MAEGSGGFTGTKTEGNEDVHYRDGEEVARTPHGGGSGSGSGGGDSGGSGEGGPSGSGDGGRSARVSAIRAACQSILSALQSLATEVRTGLSSSRASWSNSISQAVSSIKTAA
ncbi:MAG: hypothetical protein IJL80_02385, partial [Treponema sp.]|nr:hypothetical protein [Treponema sp.]